MKPFPHPIEIIIEAEVRASESQDKVKLAMKGILPEAEPIMDEVGRRLVASSNDIKALKKVYEQFRSRRTLAVARRLMLWHLDKDSTWLSFNKQAAYKGPVVVCEDGDESSLGPIILTVRSERIGELVDWLTLE